MLTVCYVLFKSWLDRYLGELKVNLIKNILAGLSVVFLISCAPLTQTESEPLYCYQDKQTQYYGLKNAAGEIIIPAQYDMIYIGDHIFEEDHGIPLFADREYTSEYVLPTMIVVKKNGRLWWIDRTGTKIFESFFFDNGPDYFRNGLSRILKENKFGFINKEGHVVIEPQYDFASPFDEAGFANVCTGCWLSYPPHTKFPIAHSSVNCDVHGTIVGGKWGIISVAGKVVVPLVHGSSKEARKVLHELKLGK